MTGQHFFTILLEIVRRADTEDVSKFGHGLERLHKPVDHLGGLRLRHLGKMSIDRGGAWRVVAEIFLNQTQVDALLEKMCGIGVSERAHGSVGFVNATFSQGSLESHLHVAKGCGLRGGGEFVVS